jgi:hypothetical protein
MVPSDTELRLGYAGSERVFDSPTQELGFISETLITNAIYYTSSRGVFVDLVTLPVPS